MFWSNVWPLSIYWVVVFVCCYVVVEFGQNYLYDETTPAAGLKVAIGSLILAGILMYTRSRLDTMFTERIDRTILQAIAWFAVFTMIFRFQPVHGGVIGIVAMCIISVLATMAVDSTSTSTQLTVRQPRVNRKPPRRPSVYIAPVEKKDEATAPTKE
jgi:peptidoglycan/LPS O-acetylase OafA/YrhL